MAAKLKMLLVGPGFGHNTKNVLDSFKGCDLWDVTFLATKLDSEFVTEFQNIKFISYDCRLYPKRPFFTLKNMLKLAVYARFKEKYDVIYNLGMCGIMHAPLYLFARKKTILAFEIWSNTVLDSACSHKSFSEKIDAYILKKTDLVCQYWWGIKEKFVNLFPQYEDKWLMYQLSYPDIYFSDEKHQPESEFVKNFLARIPKDQIVCFWPRSIIPSTNHGLTIEALGKIKAEAPELLSKFKLYLWAGNIDDANSRKIIDDGIEKYGLQDNIEIVRHPFVPTNDIFAIEERTDFFINVVNADVLSTFIMEMICSKKPFVLSNLRTFQFLNEKYGLNIPMVDNNVDEVAVAIKTILMGNEKTTCEEYENRKQLCREFFSKSLVKNRNVILYEKVVELRNNLL